MFFVNFLSANDKKIILTNETSWAPYYCKEMLNGGYTTEINGMVNTHSKGNIGTSFKFIIPQTGNY